MGGFQFGLGESVELKDSGERGTVIGRAEYLHDSNSYYIRYVAADGKQVKDWWEEPALTEVRND